MRILAAFAHNPRPWTGAGNHTYVIRTSEATLIDAGEGARAHLDEVDAAAAGLGLSRVLVTHAHVDHVAGVEALAERFPGVRFAKHPWPGRDGRYAVAWEPLRDGDIVDVGGAALQVIHTPGHSPDHVCFLDPGSGVLFGGDLVINGGTVAILASHGGSLRQYLRSLRTILDLRPRRILPAHGPPIDDPAALIRGYLAHRGARERQILDALASAPLTADDLVARLYPGLRMDLLDAAGESVLAHLIKLEEDGAAARETGDTVTHWRLA